MAHPEPPIEEVTLDVLLDLEDWIGPRDYLYEWGIGPDGTLYCVVAVEGHRANWSPEQDGARRVIGFLDDTLVYETTLEGHEAHYHFVQPMPDGGLLLVRARTDRDVPNAWFFNADGRREREIYLGDAIEDVQVTKRGRIWVSYFDEANAKPNPGHGLIAVDDEGHVEYEFKMIDGVDGIFDCYALNVVSDSNTWLYYHTDFPLVQVSKDRVVRYWINLPRGAHRIALHRQHVLMSPGYPENDPWRLFDLHKDGSSTLLRKVRFFDRNETRLEGIPVIARGETVLWLQGSMIYRCQVSQLK